MRVKIACQNCKKEILTFPSRLGRKKYCSHSCKAKMNIAGWNKGKSGYHIASHPVSNETRKKISATQQGINLSEWKEFKRPINYIERRRFQQTMQKQIFERDGWKCTMCNSKKDLQVDHIQKWSEFEELRFSIENCRTLCARCHYLITFKKTMPENISGWGHNFLQGGNLK